MRLESELTYRYPGTKFFEPGQKDIFFGRKQETYDLVHSIKAHDVFVIFADSGIGKTSLLNAGLIPELLLENLCPIKFRFQDTKTTPLQIIRNKLLQFIDPLIASSLEPEEKLWRLFRHSVFKNEQVLQTPGKGLPPATPLFIFDQFEEFFAHGRQDREACIAEISDLVNDYLPDYVKEEMKAKFKERDPDDKELLYYTPAHVKMVFLIRADKLKLLDDLSQKIPLILRNRFHLRPLTTRQAEQAILLPAALPRNGFIAPPFSFQEEAVGTICQNLENQEGEVESFHLQILCRELEKRIIERSHKGENNLWISESELGGKAGIENITKNYYSNQLNSIRDTEDRRKARLLMEEKLIIDERRISLPESYLFSERYSKELIDYLLNVTRLIRVDNNRYVEISHDRLIRPILESKQQREKEEAEANDLAKLKQLEKEKEQKNRELTKERKIKKRFLYFGMAASLLLLTSVFFFGRMIRLDAKAKIAAVKYLIEIQKIEEADSVLNSNKFLSALSFYHKDSIGKLRQELNEIELQKEKFFHFSRKGDSLFSVALPLLTKLDTELLTAASIAGEAQTISQSSFAPVGNALKRALTAETILQARKYYEQALETEFTPEAEDSTAEFKLEIIDGQMQHFFKQCMDAADFFLLAGDRQGAQAAYTAGRQIDSVIGDSSSMKTLSRLKEILKQ